jgi:hypothetical protein
VTRSESVTEWITRQRDGIVPCLELGLFITQIRRLTRRDGMQFICSGPEDGLSESPFLHSVYNPGPRSAFNAKNLAQVPRAPALARLWRTWAYSWSMFCTGSQPSSRHAPGPLLEPPLLPSPPALRSP